MLSDSPHDNVLLFLNSSRHANICILVNVVDVFLVKPERINQNSPDLDQNILYVFVSQIIPQGVAPAPCIPCCLVLTDRKLLTCHQDCQTSFFRSLGGADLNDVTAVCLEDDKEYCVIVRLCADCSA